MSTNMEDDAMKFIFKKIGPIKNAELELGDLTIIAGRNNTGKSYLVYALYGFLKWFSRPDSYVHLFFSEEGRKLRSDKFFSGITDLVSKAMEQGQAEMEISRGHLAQQRKNAMELLTQTFSEKELHHVFSGLEEDFRGASINVELGEEFPEQFDLSDFVADIPLGGKLSTKYDGEKLLVTWSQAEEQAGRLFAGKDEMRRSVIFWGFYFRFLFPELRRYNSNSSAENLFISSAERFSISLFYKELDFTKSKVMEIIQQMVSAERREDRLDPLILISKLTNKKSSRYARPIRDNIDFTRDLPETQKRTSELYECKLHDEIKEMMGGYYRIANETIMFRSKARGKEHKFAIPLYLASSSARGLSDLYFFLRHIAEPGQLLMIDEPESHLDTVNQRLMARLLARLVKAGLKVLITTHSDYLIMEINNLIMLSGVSKDKKAHKAVREKHKYAEGDFLEPDKVRAYVANGTTLERCKIDKLGIEMPVFDDAIDAINSASSALAARLSHDEEE